MVGKTNSINLLGGGDTQTAKYITVADTLANLVQAFKNGDTSAYFTPLKQQCNIWLSSGNGNVNFVPKPCIISFTDSKLLLSKYSSMTYGSQYAHLYWFSGLLEGRVYYEIQIGILTNTAATETASSNYEVADVYVSDYSFVDNNVSIGTSGADTSGTITEEQLNILENNDHKLIYFYGDYFRKNRYYASKLVYTCLTYNDTNETLIKFITINDNTREWQLTTKKVEGGGSGGKYSNHLHYDIHLEGSWDTSNTILTFDTATQNAIKVVLDKLDELTMSDNYDFLVNMRVAGKASAEGEIVVVGANMKLNYIPGASAVRNLQTQFIVSINNPDAKIIITNTEFTSNDTSFHTFISGVYAIFQFDINY